MSNNTLFMDKETPIVVYDNLPYLNSISFSIMIKVGSINESKQNEGLSHFNEHLTFRRNGISELSDKIDELGGSLRAFTSSEYTSFYGKVLKDNFEKAFSTVLDFIVNPLFNEKDVEIEREVILKEMLIYDESYDQQIRRISLENIFNNDSLSNDILGSKQFIENVDLENILQFRELHYKKQKIVVTISGNLDSINKTDFEEKVRNQLTFSNIDNSYTIDRTFKNGEHTLIVENLNQAHLAVTYEGYSREISQKKAVTLILINVMVTELKSSLLNKSLREEKGLIYNIYSYPAFYDTTGLLQIFTSTTNEKSNEVKEIILNEINSMRDKKFDDTLISKAKNRLKSELSFQLESPENRVLFFGRNILLNEGFYDNFLEVIDQIDNDDIEKVYKEIFTKEPSITVIKGD